MDAVVHRALDEICGGAAAGLHLRHLWPKLSPYLDSLSLPLCPNVKRAVWENLVDIPGLKIDACDSAVDLIECSVEECEEMDVKLVAPEAMRRSFLGIYETEASETSVSDTQRLILERLAVARTNGIAASDLAKELGIASNNLFYQLKKLETQGLIVKQSSVIRTKQSTNDGEPKNDSVVHTSMLYLYRYGKHLGCQQRLEITREDKDVTDGHAETGDDFGKEIAKEDLHIKDYLPAFKAICDKLEKAQGKVLVVKDIKQDLGYRGTSGHRAWRHLCHKLKDARVVEECCTMINKKEVNCLRLLRRFSPSLFGSKPHGCGHDNVDMKQSMNLLKRGQITEQLVELPVLRQVYDMIDAAGSKGLTNTEVCGRLGLRIKEYHKLYFKQFSRFGLYLQPESHKRGEVYRVWTARNFKSSPSTMAPIERETVLQEVKESNSLIVDLDLHDNLSQPVKGLDPSSSAGNVRGINVSENDGAILTEISHDTIVDDGGSSIQLLQCDPHNSEGAPDDEILNSSKSVTNNNQLETHSPVLVKPTRRRSYMRYPRLSVGETSSQREQHVLKMLQDDKFLIKPELHRRLESLEQERNTMMDRKTLERCLNKLQQQGHCKCIHVNVPGVTNCSRRRTTEVVLHPSVYSMSPELLAQIHDRMRSFEIQVRKPSYTRQKKGQPVPILENVQRIPNSVQLDVPERDETMSANGFVLAKMVRVKLLHIFLWGWVCDSSGRDDALLSINLSDDLKSPHSSCKSFQLELAIKYMPLGLFLQVVGSVHKFEDMAEKCKNGSLLSDLPIEEYNCLTDTRASARLSRLIDILRRLKLIRFVSKGHTEDGASRPQATFTDALELKPYIEEPVSTVASSGLIFPDLRPQVRHDFVLSSREAVNEYWNTLEYCYAAAKSKAALLAFPGSTVHEVFHSRSWASVRTTAGQRVELEKRVAKDDPNKRLSFTECEKIANDLDLSLEQVLRVYYGKSQQRQTRLQKVGDAKEQDFQTVEGKCVISSRKRKCRSDRMSKRVKASIADGQSSLEVEQHAMSNADKEAGILIHKQSLSKSNAARQKKFSWTEEADRQLVIEYAKKRVELGAKSHRVNWASISNLPAPPNSCRRRMASLNSDMPFRKAVMRLCIMLSERYVKYLENFQNKTLNHGDLQKMVRDPPFAEEILNSLAPLDGTWANFDEIIIKIALEDVLRCKRKAKLESTCRTFSDQQNSEEEDFNGCGGTKAFGRRSGARQIPRKYFKLSNKGVSVSRWMHESVAIANAVELFKMIFLSNSTASEIPILLAETLRHYSEHDLIAAFNFLREKKIMVGDGCNKPFVLSQRFLHSILSSTFPPDSGKRAAKFIVWLREREKDLMEAGVDVPSDLQCGELYTLCALVSSGEMSVTAFLPHDGVGEAEDNRISKRKFHSSEPGDEETSKRSKTTFAGEGEITSRREKGFPGIKLSLHLETISRLLAVDLFKDGNLYPAPLSGGEDQSNILSGSNANCGSSHSDVADYVRKIFDSGKTTNPAVDLIDVSESSWEAMSRYAQHLISSCSYEVKSSMIHPHLFKTLHSAIQNSGDNGLSMKEIRKALNIDDEKILEVMIEVLGAFGRALKVNAYDSIHVVNSLYRSKYFLTSNHLEARKGSIEDGNMSNNLDNQRKTVASTENGISVSANEVHRVTILNLPENVADPPAELLIEDKTIMGCQHSEVDLPERDRVENFKLHSADMSISRPLLPWMNGDGTTNELVHKGLIRRILGIVIQNPGILEDGIVNQMHALNPQSCRRLLEIMIMDNHIIRREMLQGTSTQPPFILGKLLGDMFKKSKLVSRVHYFANPMSTTLL